jgi:hypothetical protein
VMLLLSCAQVEVQNSISGRIKNMLNGEPIAGATVLAGGYTATTDTSGNFFISVDKSEPSVSGVFAVFKGLEYKFFAMDQVSIDAASNPVFNFSLRPIETGYPFITLSGRVYYADGTTELEDGSVVALYILNSRGGIEQAVDTNYSQAGGGYSLISRALGTDCFVGVLVVPSGGTFFSFYLKNQVLSTNQSEYDLIQPATGFTSLTLNGPIGAGLQGSIEVPGYGLLSGFIQEAFAGTPLVLDVYNPDNYAFNWMVRTLAAGPGAGDTTVRATATALAALSSPITLSVPSGGPAAIVDAAGTAAWDSGTRTLSFDTTPALGASGFALNLADGSAASGAGILWMSSGSFTLPAALVTDVLDAGTAWDVQVIPAWTPAGTDVLSLFLKIGPSNFPEGIGFELVQVMPGASGTAVDLIP